MEYREIEFRVSWEIEDDYVGKSRPQTTIVRPSDYYGEEEWNDMSEIDREVFVEECVQEDFNQKVSFSIYDYGLNK